MCLLWTRSARMEQCQITTIKGHIYSLLLLRDELSCRSRALAFSSWATGHYVGKGRPMTANLIEVCPFCRAKGAMRQICHERFVWGGVPFACLKCGGGYFQRFASQYAHDDYWEG